MRILFTVDQAYLPQRTGGALTSTDALCRPLAARGHAVAVLAELMPGGTIGFMNRWKRRFGRRPPRDSVVGYPVYRDWNPASQVPAVCRSFQPDVAVVKAGEDPRVAEAISALGIPTLVYILGIGFDRDDWAIPRGANISFLANTTYAAERFEARFGQRVPVIHSLIHAADYVVESSRKVVTFINPKPEKGLETAFDLARHRPDIPFHFVESWPLGDSEHDDLKDRAAALGNVTIRRWMLDMKQVFADTRILLVPTPQFEGQARSVAEAQVSGIPVLASQIGGLPESVGPGGIVVPPTDTEGWRRALDALWDDAETYARAAAQAQAHSRRLSLQPEHIISSLLALVEAQVTPDRAFS
ncbi:MAG: glycosyltransferase [Alphaproteobacteria bacterium]